MLRGVGIVSNPVLLFVFPSNPCEKMTIGVSCCLDMGVVLLHFVFGCATEECISMEQSQQMSVFQKWEY